jgi:Arc/MetJ-type ribon-helix-helix transcriptional regulator
LTVVPVRLSEEEVRKLNLLLRRGTYRSRNEAIRAILSERLEERLCQDEDVSSLVDALLAQSKKGKVPISFKAEKSVIEIVAEGRI